jgi:hypothetical protein
MQTIAFDKRSFLVRVYGITLSVVALYFFLYLIFNAPVYKAFLMVALASLLVVGLVLTRKTLSIDFATHYYTICCYILLTVNMAITGGLNAPGAVWFLICPLVNFLTLSGRLAAFWLGLVLATLLSFYFLDEYLVFDTFRGGKQWYLITQLLFFPTVFTFVKIFRMEVSKKSRALERLNTLLEEKQESLEQSQQELIHQRDQLKKAQEEALTRNQKSTGYLNQLIDISRMEELHTGSLEFSIQTIQRWLLKSMQLDSVIVWSFDEERKRLKLIGFLGLTADEIIEPANFLGEKFQDTFEMLQSGAILATPDAHSLALSMQFRKLSPGASIIGCPYFIEGRFAGFFTCVASDRKWSSEDVLFIRAISDTLPLAFKSHQRKIQQLLLEEKQRQITELNDSLERRILERTAELNIRNKQLVDFAFINAHEIRGPICRLLGLRNLLAITSDPQEVIMLGEYMTASIEELDKITHRASLLLNEAAPQTNVSASNQTRQK